MNKYADEIRKTCPYTADYIEKYGVQSLASTFEVPPKYRNAEAMYKVCAEKGKKWTDIVTIEKDVIL